MKWVLSMPQRLDEDEDKEGKMTGGVIMYHFDVIL